MLVDYATKYYFTAHNAAARLHRDNLREARELADHLDHLRYNWHQVRVLEVNSPVGPQSSVTVRGQVMVNAKVALGPLSPGEIEVQLYHGTVNSFGELEHAEAISMRHDRQLSNGEHQFSGSFTPERSGQHGIRCECCLMTIGW